jgi:predicted nucleic acid-binding protein
MRFKVVQSFASAIIGGHAEGEIIELTDEQAHDLQAFLKRLDEESPVVETADLPLETVEKAVATSKRKKKEA